MLFGYARVSTEDQLLNLQTDALNKAGVANGQVYHEQVSGVKTKRPELYACMKSMREGDTLIVWRLDRLGRSVPELIKLMVDMQERGIEFRSLTEAIDTSTAAGKMVFHMLAAFAEFERNLISERTKAGLKAARARGHRGGRKPKVTPRKMRIVKSLLLDPTVIMQEAADAIGVSRAAVYRALAREKEGVTYKELKKASKRLGNKV